MPGEGMVSPSGPGPLPPASPGPAIPGLRAATLSWVTTSGGALLFLLGLASASFPAPEFYQGPLSGFDPPFLAISGILLLGVSVRVRERSLVAWLFAMVAPALTLGIAVLSPNLYSALAGGLSCLLLGLLYAARSRFYRRSFSGQEATQFAVLLGGLLSLLYGLVGTRILGSQFGPAPGIQGWAEGLYFTITTISTNGSSYVPLTNAARLFTVVLILLGVGTFLSVVVVFFLPFIERRIERVARRLERRQMEQISDHVIVCGTSPQVRAIVETLRQEQVPAVILGADSAAISQLAAEGFRAQVGETSSEVTLRSVGLDRARALVAADESDAENLLTVITARGLRPDLRIVAVALASRNEGKLEKAGANAVVSLMNLAARLVRDAALAPST